MCASSSCHIYIASASEVGLQEPSQMHYLTLQGCIKLLCELLQMMDSKIIIRFQCILFVEEAGGVVTVYNLQ